MLKANCSFFKRAFVTLFHQKNENDRFCFFNNFHYSTFCISLTDIIHKSPLMKKLLPLIFLSFAFTTFGQVNYTMPPEANAFYDNAMQKINPAIKSLIEKKADNLKGRSVNMDSLLTQLHKETVLKNSSKESLQAITVLIMVQLSKNADADLKNLVINLSKNKTRDTISETSENKVANILANKSLIAEGVTIALKKMPAAQEIVLENLK